VYVSPNHPDHERLTGQGGATAAGPAPSGDLLARFPRKGPRGVEQELRLLLAEYEGHPYLALRLWERDQGGAWWPTRKGVSIRMGEAGGLAGALLAALDDDHDEGPGPDDPVATGRRPG
jgi:hypothetical protein